jgi:hypothetical protein
MDNNSAIAEDGSVTPIAVARVRRETIQTLTDELEKSGIKPIDLPDGRFLVEQGRVAKAGVAYYVARGMLKGYRRFDLRMCDHSAPSDVRRRRAELTPLVTIPAGRVAFVQGLFRNSINSTEVIATTTIIATEPTRVYPISASYFVKSLFPLSIMSVLFEEIDALHSNLVETASEDDLAALAEERSFELWYERGVSATHRRRSKDAERRIAELTSEMARKDAYIKALESGIEDYTRENDELRESLQSLRLFREQQRKVLITEQHLQDAVDDDEDEPDTGITDAPPHGPAKPEPPPAADITASSADADEDGAPPDIEIIGIEVADDEMPPERIASAETDVEELGPDDIKEITDGQVGSSAKREAPAAPEGSPNPGDRPTYGYGDGRLRPFGGQRTPLPRARNTGTLPGIPLRSYLEKPPIKPIPVVVSAKGSTGPKR